MTAYKTNKKQDGFSLIEIMLYVAITTILLLMISSIVINTMNARKHLRASEAIQHNARFMMNFMTNRIHNATVVDVVSPSPEQIIFYTSTSTRFSFTEEGGNLLFRQSENTGAGFPLQASVTPLQVNSNDAVVSNFLLVASDDNFGHPNRGISIDFTLTTGSLGDMYIYQRADFKTLISVR